MWSISWDMWSISWDMLQKRGKKGVFLGDIWRKKEKKI
jgi:hypothetical protein